MVKFICPKCGSEGTQISFTGGYKLLAFFQHVEVDGFFPFYRYYVTCSCSGNSWHPWFKVELTREQALEWEEICQKEAEVPMGTVVE